MPGSYRPQFQEIDWNSQNNKKGIIQMDTFHVSKDFLKMLLNKVLTDWHPHSDVLNPEMSVMKEKYVEQIITQMEETAIEKVKGGITL